MEGYFSETLTTELRVFVGLAEADPWVDLHDLVPEPENQLLALGIEADSGVEPLNVPLYPGHRRLQLLIGEAHAMKRIHRGTHGQYH